MRPLLLLLKAFTDWFLLSVALFSDASWYGELFASSNAIYMLASFLSRLVIVGFAFSPFGCEFRCLVIASFLAYCSMSASVMYLF